MYGATVACLPFLRRRSKKSKKRISWPTVNLSKDVYPSELQVKKCPVNMSSEAVESFSLTELQRGHTRLVLNPYFGPFAGQQLTFDIKRGLEPRTLTSVKVRVCDHANTPVNVGNLYPNGTECVYDRCLQFAHETQPDNMVKRMQQPKTLQFLCERTIILYNLDVDFTRLPVRFSYLQKKLEKVQVVNIKVWSSFAEHPQLLRMNLKTNMSIAELKWMLCHRLSLTNPAKLLVYETDELQCLSSEAALCANTKHLNCVILPSFATIKECNKTVYVTVSMIGEGINQIKVDPDMTFFQFTEAVRSKFSLKSGSFIYFPGVFQEVVADSGLRMTSLVDDSTIDLIDNKRRNLPVVDGKPPALVNLSRIPMFKRCIAEHGVLLAGPVVAFEVTGPTIPVKFRSTRDEGCRSDFVVVLERIHAMSVNPRWTVGTFLKYVECFSRLPCLNVRIGKDTLAHKELCHQLCSRTWKTHHTLKSDVPEISHS